MLTLVSGDEDFLVERAVLEEARSSLGDVHHFHMPGGMASYRELLLPSVELTSRLCLVLWGADSVPDPLASDPAITIVVSKKKLSHPLARRSLHFPKLKAFLDRNDVLGWIIQEGERLNIGLSRVAEGLFVNCGNSLRKIASEIEKLSVIVPRGGEATPDDARSVLCFSAEITPRDVVDSMCDGQTCRAIALYDKLQERDETGWILAYVYRHALSQFRANLLLGGGMPPDGAASIIGVHPFVFRKVWVPRSSLWSEDSLRESVSALSAFDVLHKRGKDVACLLEFEIVRLSEEARCLLQRR